MIGIDVRAAKVTWTVILVLAMCWGLYAIRSTLFFFIAALLFAYLVLPLVDFIDRVLPLERSRTPALAIVYTLLVGGLVLGGAAVGSRASQQANLLATKVTDLLKPVPEPLTPQVAPPLSARLASTVREQIREHYQEILAGVPKAGFTALSAAANLVFLIVVPILSFFILKDARVIQRFTLAAIHQGNHLLITGIIEDMNLLLAQYMRALVLLGSSAFVAYAAFFTIMGVPYSILLAALSFFLEFIPMVGPLISSAIILLVTGFSTANFWAVVAFLGIYRLFQDYVLSPHLMSSGMELHPLLIIFGVFAGEHIGGVGGAFLSVPILATLRIVYQRLVRA
ncbi:MAG: AI-2E family transporter, partial [Bryobacteraceae bacterium]